MKIKKSHILALLNIAAAAAIGISAGMLYKYYMKDRAAEKLRDKIEEDSKNPRYIKTVYGIGYTWAAQ